MNAKNDFITFRSYHLSVELILNEEMLNSSTSLYNVHTDYAEILDTVLNSKKISKYGSI